MLASAKITGVAGVPATDANPGTLICSYAGDDTQSLYGFSGTGTTEATYELSKFDGSSETLLGTFMTSDFERTAFHVDKPYLVPTGTEIRLRVKHHDEVDSHDFSGVILGG